MRVSANISPNWQQATTLDELVDGPVVFKSGRRQLAVFRVETDGGPTVYAVDNRCPHEGYPLAEGTVDESCQLTCNWHNWKFRLDDGKCVLGGDNLGRYDVRVEADGGVLVDLSEATPGQQRAEILGGLQTAFRERDFGRICREITRMHFCELDPLDAVREALRWAHDRFEYGTTHAVAVAADWVGLADGYDDWERRLVCLAECVDHLAFDALRHPEYAYAKASESEFSTGAFLAAVEAERREEAEGLVVRGIDDGLHFDDMQPAFAAAALAHYNDFGHSLIYVQKTGELIERLGPEIQRWVLPPLARTLVYATREDQIPEFGDYAATLESARSLGTATQASGDLDGESLAGHGVRGCLAWTLDAISRAGPERVEEVHEVLFVANARQMVFYDTDFQDAFDRSVNDSVGWLSFTHALTFSHAVRTVCRQNPVLWNAGLLQMACFVGRNQKYQDTSIDAVAWQVEDSGAFLETVHGVLLDHGMRDPIFSAHLVKTSLAIEKELDEASESTRAWLLSGLNRFLNSPLKQKHVRRLARQAIDLVGRDY
jgi:nitrite reductase/ring-hydroxylating ferredoxin subunit